jgi:ABC-type uncharacterized transport system ATPase subunit
MTALIEVKNVSKSFGKVEANKNLSLYVNPGEIVALLGENGAGKSTLVKQIFGLITPDSGTISVKGDATPIKDPSDAINRGIGMVHQHFQLVPVMSVAENIVLGNEPVNGLRLNLQAARDLVKVIAEKIGMEVDPDIAIEDLPVGTQQRVEILKALSRKVDLLILDEPTAVLTPQETDELLGVMRQLASQGTAIVFITHKLREVLAVSDRIYVLRDGELAGEVKTSDATEATLAQLMVGREVVLRVHKNAATPGTEVLNVKDLVVLDDRKLVSVNSLSLNVKAGEIVGVAGVEGNGQRELVEAIAGMRKIESGTIVVFSKDDITKANPFTIHALGIGHIPEDREKHGLVASYSLADNLVLNRYSEPEFATRGVRNFKAINENADQLIDKFDIRTSSSKASAASLSGGNKQKVVVARELSAEPGLLIAAQPTRGVDVGSIEFIHNQIVAARDAGAGVLLVSAELDEVLSLADRVLVIHKGQIVAEMQSVGADRVAIGRLMTGGH